MAGHVRHGSSGCQPPDDSRSGSARTGTGFLGTVAASDRHAQRSGFLWRLDAACMLAARFPADGSQGFMDQSLGQAAGYMSKSERNGVNRRSFLKSAVTGMTAAAATGAAAAMSSA